MVFIQVLSGLYLYGMLNRIRSSRQLEAACWNRLDVIWLMSGQRPDPSTIAALVTDHRQELRQLFRDVLPVAVRAELVKLEHVAVDGTKREADAGKGSVHQEGTIGQELGETRPARVGPPPAPAWAPPTTPTAAPPPPGEKRGLVLQRT